MKKFIIVSAALLVSSLAFAAGKVDFKMTNNTFSKGDIVGSALVGFTKWGYEGYTAPIKISGEYGLIDNLINGNNGSIGVGLMAAFAPTKYYPVQGWVSNRFNMVIAATGSFHYQFVEKLDTYLTLNLGYHAAFCTDKQEIPGGTVDSYVQNSFFYGFNLGARYYFTNSFAACAELGYGLSIISIGVSKKF